MFLFCQLNWLNCRAASVCVRYHAFIWYVRHSKFSLLSHSETCAGSHVRAHIILGNRDARARQPCDGECGTRLGAELVSLNSIGLDYKMGLFYGPIEYRGIQSRMCWLLPTNEPSGTFESFP